MAKTFYKAVISYKDENEQSKYVVKKSNLLIEAISYSEAEKVAYALFMDEINPTRMPKEWQKTSKVNDFFIKSLNPQDVEDVVIGENDSKGENLQWWFRGKVKIEDGDIKTTSYFYVSGDDLTKASIQLKEFLDKNYTAVDTKIESVILTNINGVYEYNAEVVEYANHLVEEELEKQKEEDAKTE